MGRKVRVDRIVYTPRNRDNYVRPDDLYELFYCDKDWKSAGKIKATADSLVFRYSRKYGAAFEKSYTWTGRENLYL